METAATRSSDAIGSLPTGSGASKGAWGVMRALQEGDRVEIIDGVFKQLRGRITRMDRRRKTVRVELDTQGAIRHIWLSYEIVDRVDAERLPVAGDEGARGLEA